MDRKIFENNLKLLSNKSPELFDIAISNPLSLSFLLRLNERGQYLLFFHDTPMEDPKDPEAKATKDVQRFLSHWKANSKEEIKVFGIGLLYHVEALLKFLPNTRVVVFEPEPMFFRAICECKDLSHILDRVEFKIGASSIPWNVEFDYIHLPSMKYHRNFMNILSKRRLITLEKLPAFRLNVVVVSPVYGGSLTTAIYVKNAFEKLDYNVTYIDLSKFSELYRCVRENIKQKDNQNLILNELTMMLSRYCAAVIADIMPHLVLCLAQAPLLPPELSAIRQAGIVTAMWFVENYRILEYWKEIASRYDFFFIIQKGEFEEILTRMGLSNFCYLPMAADLDMHRPIDLSFEDIKRYGSSVSFMGAGYPNRRNILKRLVNHDLKIWGNGWENMGVMAECVQENGRRVSIDETVKIYNSSLINLNIHSSTTAKGLEEKGDYINPRTFEIAACKGFQLVDNRRYLNELFELGSEMITFTDEREMVKLIDHFLHNPHEREEVASLAYNRTQRDHSYTNRMFNLIEFIWATRPTAWEKSIQDMALARSVMDRWAEIDPELKTFLDCMPQKSFYPLNELVSLVQMNKNSLRDFELLFLLMNEAKREIQSRR